MRHLLLALPPVLLAACAEPCTAPALTVSWRFDLADGRVDAGCQDAGVATVDLWMGDQQLGAGMRCDQGAATFPGLAAGPQAFTIQGRSAGGQLLSQQWGQLEVGSCGETRVTLKPGAGVLRIAYATPDGACTDAGSGSTLPGYLWYAVQDRTEPRPVVSIVNATQTPTLLACQVAPAVPAIDLTLPYGLYSLRWIQVVRSPIGAPAVAAFQSCTPIDVDLRAQGVTAVPVNLYVADNAPCVP